MSSITSGAPGIGNTGSGNAAYISGSVMMDVMMSCWKGISVCCCRWDRPFYPSSLLTLCTLCRSDCCVMTMVPTGYILLFMPFLYLRDELFGVLTPLCRQFYFLMLLLSWKFVHRGSLWRCCCYS